MGLSASENSATIGASEHSLPANTTVGVPTSQTDACILQVWLDLANLAYGDLFELAIYEKIQAGGTQRVVERFYFDGVQQQQGWVMPSLMVRNGWDVTLKKISGTDRSIGWSLRKVT